MQRNAKVGGCYTIFDRITRDHVQVIQRMVRIDTDRYPELAEKAAIALHGSKDEKAANALHGPNDENNVAALHGPKVVKRKLDYSDDVYGKKHCDEATDVLLTEAVQQIFEYDDRVM
jgi:hypothetical protein